MRRLGLIFYRGASRGTLGRRGYPTLPANNMPHLRASAGKNARNRPSLHTLEPANLLTRGFTLVEILVVVVIVGIGLSIAVSNLFVSDEEQVRQEAERLMALIEKTRDQAAFSGYPIAMRLTDQGVAFMERDPNSIEAKWIDATSGSLKPRAWRDGVTASLAVSATDTAPQPTDAQQIVTFLPAGVGVPFTVRVASSTHQRMIVGDALGNVSFAATKAAP